MLYPAPRGTTRAAMTRSSWRAVASGQTEAVLLCPRVPVDVVRDLVEVIAVHELWVGGHLRTVLHVMSRDARSLQR